MLKVLHFDLTGQKIRKESYTIHLGGILRAWAKALEMPARDRL